MDNTKISSVVAKKLLAEAGENTAPERLLRRSRHRVKIKAERQAASKRRKRADAARAGAPGQGDPTGVEGPDRDPDTRDDKTTGI